ncbi:hypothetical protein [Uliginosibacterium sp. 31-12]|uniref:hypothetical protein n=1 Tax=Uliginosibacterium sp. 31-12 TaxID=3062781 RepID=UPI0026E37FE7|nr:hypothetical protein [Uliginosibacterium sp. 31-12]MDO6385612.1 hypothetical protein [Uliginosibacterium sp. 31-12]
MKKIAAIIALALTAGPALADKLTSGYVRQDGTYVAPSYRSTPNNTTLDNYSTRGNTNPYTGQAGTRSPDYGSTHTPSQRQPNYGTPAPNPYQPYRNPYDR